MAPPSRFIHTQTSHPAATHRPWSPSRRRSSSSSTSHFTSPTELQAAIEQARQEQGLVSDHEGDDFLFELGSREPLNPASSTTLAGSGSPPEAFRVVPAEEDIGKERPSMDVRTSTQRFQAATRKIINVQRTMSYTKGWSTTGREPGIDPARVDLPDLKNKCVVQVVDLCREDARFTVLENADVPGFLEKPRPDWVKVRWLHVNGLSWDVIKPLALEYNLHPLSLEDMLHHGTSSTRSKADYYKQHLFVSVVVHKTQASDAENDVVEVNPRTHKRAKANHLREQLGFHSRQHKDAESRIESHGTIHEDRDESGPPTSSNASQRSSVSMLSSHEQFRLKMVDAFDGAQKKAEEDHRVLSSNTHGLTNRIFNRHRAGHKAGSLGDYATREAARHTVNSLTQDVKIHIHVEQLSIFVLRNGTVVSFTQDPGYHRRFSTIFDRIQSSGDLIRDSEDPSFILQALLDVVADHALEIVDDFRDQITRLESRVLARPDMSDVRHLHILSAQLLLLKSTLSPLQHLLQGIRLQDDAKAAAASRISIDTSIRKNNGFVSFEAKIYLEDVIDHVESVMSSLDLFASLAENLIAYTFNTVSYQSNSYMQALSVLSVIFLPLTFLSGYFGMNFTIFPDVVDPTSSVTLFWKIAVPISVATTLLFSWTYIAEGVRGMRRELMRVYRERLFRKHLED